MTYKLQVLFERMYVSIDGMAESSAEKTARAVEDIDRSIVMSQARTHIEFEDVCVAHSNKAGVARTSADIPWLRGRAGTARWYRQCCCDQRWARSTTTT